MIDPKKCKFEDYYQAPEDTCDTYYFIYPKDGHAFRFSRPLHEYGNVIFVCISMTVARSGESWLMASPTVEDEDGIHDVDWQDLEPDIDYDASCERRLLKMGKDAVIHGRKNL